MITNRTTAVQVMAICSCLLVGSFLLAPEGHAVELSKGNVTKVEGKKLCGLFKNKWRPIERVAGKKREYNQIVGSKAHRRACSSLLSSRSVKSLSQLPSIADVARAKSGGSGSTQTVSGTPPTLKSIPDSGAKDIFWSEGVIDRLAAGTPTQDDCNQFFGGNVDGASGGLAACFMTQNVGFSFENLLQSGTSLCYMKGISDPSLGEDGGVIVEQGTLAGNTIARIFSPGTNDARLVNVSVSGFPDDGPPEENSVQEDGAMDIYIKVAPQSQNARKGNQYEVELFHCDSSTGDIDEYEHIQIRTNGQYVSKSRYRDDGIAFIKGWLTRDGENLVFDPSKDREVTFVSLEDGSGFGSNVVFKPDNTIRTKHYDRSEQGARRAYAVSSFSGSGMNDLRFLAGAYQDEKEGSPGDGFEACVEYRDTLYAASPSSELCDEARDVDVNQDSFFESIEDEEVAVPEFDCTNPEPDVVVAMDFTKPSTAALAEECEADRLNNMNFCRDDDISQAENNFFAQCGLQG